jgi:hypothetical protein
MRYPGADGRAVALRLIAECRDAQNTTLDLGSLRLTLLEADVVAGLTSLTSLTSLNLEDNNIEPDGAQALRGLTGLTSLILGINTIGAEGAALDVVGILRGAVSGNMKVSFQAARSIG